MTTDVDGLRAGVFVLVAPREPDGGGRRRGRHRRASPRAARAPGTPSSSAASGAASAASDAIATADIPVGGGKVFDALKVVVTQPTAGEFKAFTAVCTHQGCTVNGVSNGIITCPCHGATFDIADRRGDAGPGHAAAAGQERHGRARTASPVT